MKATKISSILNIWKKTYGTRWKKSNIRIGDKMHEHLIGENELPFTREIKLNKQSHYIISFNNYQKKPLAKSYSTKNSLQLSNSEIKELIKFPE